MFLASKSPQRRSLLKSLGIDFDIVEPDYAERELPGLSPASLVERHSIGKAKSVLAKLIPLPHDRPVLGVDTMVFAGGRQLGKASSAAEAMEYLRLLSGTEHQVYSGITLIWAPAGVTDGDMPQIDLPPGCKLLDTDTNIGNQTLYSCTSHECTGVVFSEVAEDELCAYIATGEWRGRAGAYAIQERASAFVKEIHGDYTNVVGLPVSLLADILRQIGCWPPPDWDRHPHQP